jgi:phospho-N-acetylmuramoyl-pentapeptide-transferase
MISTPLEKVFLLTSLGFIVALAFTPFLIRLLGKRGLGKQIRNDGSTPLFSKLHSAKAGTPTMGGILIWGTLTVLLGIFWLGDRVLHISFFHALDFYSRRETLLPFGALLGASLVGAVDDWLDVKQRGHKGRGLRFRFKFLLYTVVAAIGAWWFYFKLGFESVHVPFLGGIHLGWVFIPFFTLAVISTSFAVNETDGLDGLAGGILLTSFFAYGLIAFLQGKYDLASFIGIICGALLAFLWFNVHPAKFFMGDTGSMGLGVLLAIVAFLTNSAFLLLLIGFVFVAEAVSYLLQLFFRKVFHKKLLLSAPIHHHFQALGWPEAQVTMRFWIVAVVVAVIGVVIYFIS